MTIIEAEGFLKLIPTSAVVLNQPFGLFFSAWVMLEPVIFECMRTPPVPAGKVGIRIVMFGIVRHRFSLLAQQVSGVQADVRIVNQDAQKKQNPPKRVMPSEFCL
ncbi:hypothetical protein A8M49_26050 [Escherichia coli]|nr:hypothetical protein A8M49_26050 [Escherichia coli]